MIIAPSLMRDNAMARSWDEVMERCRTHPHEAAIRGSLQEIALHWVCYHRAPPQVWREVIRCCKAALSMKGSCGRTPLHISCANGSTTEMLQILVEADARVTFLEGNAVDKTPIAMLWNCHLPHLARNKTALQGSVLQGGKGDIRITAAERREILAAVGDVWDKMCLLVRAAHHGEMGASPKLLLKADQGPTSKRLKLDNGDTHAVSSDEESISASDRSESPQILEEESEDDEENLLIMPNHMPFRVVHSAVFLGSECPDTFLRLALSLHPEQAAMTMHHYTPKDCKARKLILPWMTHRVLAYVDVDGLPLHVAAGHRSFMGAETFRKLISAYPAAARTLNSKKQLPLHVALQRGRPWHEGLSDLVDAAPQALTTRDLNHRMYPFMLASVGKNYNLDTAFELLRAADPSIVLAHAIVG